MVEKFMEAWNDIIMSNDVYKDLANSQVFFIPGKDGDWTKTVWFTDNPYHAEIRVDEGNYYMEILYLSEEDKQTICSKLRKLGFPDIIRYA